MAPSKTTTTLRVPSELRDEIARIAGDPPRRSQTQTKSRDQSAAQCRTVRQIGRRAKRKVSRLDEEPRCELLLEAVVVHVELDTINEPSDGDQEVFEGSCLLFTHRARASRRVRGCNSSRAERCHETRLVNSEPLTGTPETAAET